MSSNQDTVMEAVCDVINVSNEVLLKELYNWVEAVNRLGEETATGLMFGDQRLNELARALYYYRTGNRIEMLEDKEL